MSRSQRARSRDRRSQEPESILKKASLYWALLVGFLSVGGQGFMYYYRFGVLNPDATALEYLLFFLAGALGGLILIYFLNRQSSAARRWVVLIAFLLASPIALFMMIAGGLLGPPGVLLFPQIPWALLAWIGSLLAKFIARA